jgi:hypothetical protein
LGQSQKKIKNQLVDKDFHGPNTMAIHLRWSWRGMLLFALRLGVNGMARFGLRVFVYTSGGNVADSERLGTLYCGGR